MVIPRPWSILVASAMFACSSIAGGMEANGAEPAGTMASVEGQIRGQILAQDHHGTLLVLDDRGMVDTVRLHAGTIIAPPSYLEHDTYVSVLGYSSGADFNANEVDTPYHTRDGTVPGVDLSSVYADPTWWHGSFFAKSPSHYVRGYRVYDGLRLADLYRTVSGGGTFRGRDFIAPASAGGYRGKILPPVNGYCGPAADTAAIEASWLRVHGVFGIRFVGLIAVDGDYARLDAANPKGGGSTDYYQKELGSWHFIIGGDHGDGGDRTPGAWPPSILDALNRLTKKPDACKNSYYDSSEG